VLPPGHQHYQKVQNLFILLDSSCPIESQVIY
jgi:hypothetical protein